MARTCFLLVACSATLSLAAADELHLNAKMLLEQSVTRDVRLSDDGNAVELEQGELFEDDGPAAGYSYQANEEQLSDRVWITKELVLPNPAARKATLLVAPGGDLQATINGKTVELQPAGKAGKYWQAYAIPPEVLRTGKNEFVLSGSGKVWIARAEDFAAGAVDRPKHPNRSAKSSDAGQTWSFDRLGPAGDIDGEYYVRLFLEHYRPAGSLTLDVLDAGNLSKQAVASPVVEPIPIRIHLDSDTDNVRLRIRSGSTVVPDPKNWTDWQGLEPGGELQRPKGRFFQLAVHLATSDPLRTPRLKGLRIEASSPAADGWWTKLKVLESHNAAIVRTAIPFGYESFDHERLKQLRSEYQLDNVVKGADAELELITRLARWSASRWDRGHLSEGYPAWDALEILKPHADGQPVGGFCQQYNLVFLQACQNFGISGRAVSIGVGDHANLRGSGHEVVEVWSNQFRKWIYVDGNLAWYAVDGESDVPLSLRDLRSRQLRELSGQPARPTRIVHLAEGGQRWEGLKSWPWFHELRLIPRSNFLEQNSPLPLNQGMRGWFWTGHHVWTDAEHPASLLYGNRVSDSRNWEWTLNQAHYTLTATSMPGELRVHLDTHTPGFDTFLAGLDGARPKPVASSFIWNLQPGINRLDVVPRNIAGREGVPGHVVIKRP